MTEAKNERINELERQLADLLKGAKDFEEKKRCVDKAFCSVLMFGAMQKEGEFAQYCHANENAILELRSLYGEAVYCPDEDEETLSYLFRENMTAAEKLKALSDAWWCATNSGYGDAMANRLMAGQEDAETKRWEQNCKNKSAIDRLWKWLKEADKNA